jgi:predicted nuclease of predicted toxin-antitoxin system
MRFLVDAQLPPGLCHWLRGHSHDAEHVVRIGLGGASDMVIANYAERTGATLVSKDDDFLRLRRPDRFGLLWLRCGNVTNAALEIWLEQRWDQVEILFGAGERLIELR